MDSLSPAHISIPADGEVSARTYVNGGARYTVLYLYGRALATVDFHTGNASDALQLERIRKVQAELAKIADELATIVEEDV